MVFSEGRMRVFLQYQRCTIMQIVHIKQMQLIDEAQCFGILCVHRFWR